MQEHPDVTILFTTGTVEAYSLLSNAVPKEVSAKPPPCVTSHPDIYATSLHQ
jgi:3-deoxy-D-manno-octulosonic-acid transferase